MKYTTNFKGDTIKDPMRQKTLEDIDIKFWISNSKELQERINKVIECLEEGIDFPYYDDDTKKYLKGMKDILEGCDE